MDELIRRLHRTWQITGEEEDLRALISALQRKGAHGLNLAGVIPGETRISVDIASNYSEDIYGYFWPSVTYKGENIVDLIMKFDERLNPVTQGVADDSQEVFLGWLPSRDYFVMGWDIWGSRDGDLFDEDDEDYEEEGDSGSFVAVFSYDAPNLIGLHTAVTYSEIFYPNTLNNLRQLYPDMIGLRYD